VLYSSQDYLRTGTPDLDHPFLVGARNADSWHTKKGDLHCVIPLDVPMVPSLLPPMTSACSVSSLPKAKPSALKTLGSPIALTTRACLLRGVTLALRSGSWPTAGHHHCMPSSRNHLVMTIRSRVRGRALAPLSRGRAM
jgi:hypothetical protein